MSAKQDATDISRRRSVFARFNRLNVAEAQQDRLRCLQEESPNEEKESSTNTWLSGPARTKWQSDQLSYAAPYIAEYQNATIMTNDEPNLTDVHLDTQSIAGSSITDNDTISSLPSIRRMRGKGIACSSRATSVLDFERTSTVLGPTDKPLEDFTNTLSAEELRKNFFHKYKPNTTLPIYCNRIYLIHSIQSYSVVIVEGATGCGKTTQVPVYILEDYILERNSVPLIYVTQPRRIAARSIANRVCEEHDWPIGSIVGYQVGLEKVMSPRTVIVFCTAGVLLQKLIQEKSLNNFTHIIIDEAHERDSDTDLLLMMIRTLMRKENSTFRLIVMSATMDMLKLKTYFTFKTNYGHKAMVTPSICKIAQGKEPTNIQVIYYDKLRTTFQVEEQMPIYELDQPEVHEECLKAAVKIIIDVIPHLDTFSDATKSTLVFLPGLAEISKLDRLLRGASNYIDVIPLHSCLSIVDQVKAFEPARLNCRKVILATNIAESSITVKDVGFIIDFCLTKTLRKDDVTKFPTLKLQWSTKDKSTQRAGRTGRCCPGKVFRMVSHSFYKEFDEFAEPELLTAPLELSVLRVKNFQMGEIKALFAVVLDPPPLHEIQTAVLELKQIGALSSTYLGKLSDIDGDLTELGRVISALPIDVHLSKLIVIAFVFDVLEDAITVAACLSTNRTVVRHNFSNPLETYRSKLDWAGGSESDLFVSLDIFKNFIELKDRQNKSASFLQTECRRKNLDERKLYEVAALVDEIKNRLTGLNIVVLEQPNRVRNRYEDELMLKIAFCASFYPNYFLTKDMDASDIRKQLCGLDCTKTVSIHNLPINQVPLYRTQILEQLKPISQNESFIEHIDYIADCSRAMLVFNDHASMLKDKSVLNVIGSHGVIEPSRDIDKSVYLAIKCAENNHICIKEFNDVAAVDRMDYYIMKRNELRSGSRLMPSWIKIVRGRPADNRKLLESSDEEFAAITAREYYIEVEFNEEQDREDLDELFQLEKLEETGKSETNKLLNNHKLFKPGYRFLKGPTSPIRMSFRPVLERSRGFSVDIENSSVNSILLNPEFQVPRRQMMVAARVEQTKRNKIMARDTTLMPNIRGLPTVMSLLFAQYYRIIYNDELKCLTGAIFGLGWREDDTPIDRNYEVELSFDVQINNDDIELINKARKNISELLRLIDVINPGAPRADLVQQLRQIILTLIRKRRCPIFETCLTTIDWKRGGFSKDKHNVPKQQLETLEERKTRVFLPLMEVTKDYSEMDMFRSIRENLNQMNLIEAQHVKPPLGGIRCLLCGGGSYDFLYIAQSKIVNHINSESHIGKLREFEIYEEHAKRRAKS